MEPLPETRAAFDAFGPFDDRDGNDLLAELCAAAEQVRVLVPSCVGVSLALMANGATFTLQATDAEIAALDAVQYLDGGPCVDGALAGEVVPFEVDDPLDESRWATFAAASAAHNVASTLTLPIVEGRDVIGTVDLYAASPHAFDGLHTEVAAVFDAWAPGAVTNADLDFTTRQVAQRAPEVLAAETVVNQAVGLLMAARGLDATAARALLDDAATRAGVAISDVARDIVVVFGRRDADGPT